MAQAKAEQLQDITMKLVQMIHEESPWTQMVEREKARLEAERLEKERLEKERLEKIEQERLEKIERERQEKIERERQEVLRKLREEQEKKERRAKAIQTLRKLPKMSDNQGRAKNFEWPTAEDLKKMPFDKPIKMSGIKFN